MNEQATSKLTDAGYSCMDTLQSIVEKLGGHEDLLRCIASFGNSHTDRQVLEELQHWESLLP
jgi:hypothetical protein